MITADAVSLAESIFNREGLLALILIVFLAIFAGVVYILYLLVKFIRDRSKEDGKVDETVNKQANVIDKLVGPLGEMAETMKAVSASNALVSANLLKVAQLLTGHDTRAEIRDKALEKAVSNMQAGDIERTRQIEAMPGRVKEELMPEFKELPKAVESALAPRIEALKAEIGILIQTLDERLSSRIDAATDAIPDRTAALVRSDLASLQKVINDLLIEMVATAQSAVVDDKPKEEKE